MSLRKTAGKAESVCDRNALDVWSIVLDAKHSKADVLATEVLSEMQPYGQKITQVLGSKILQIL